MHVRGKVSDEDSLGVGFYCNKVLCKDHNSAGGILDRHRKMTCRIDKRLGFESDVPGRPRRRER